MKSQSVDLEGLQRKRLPRLTWQHLMTGHVSLAEAVAMANYFRRYAEPSKDCLGCGAALSGLFGLIGTFTWGIAHGEGVCRDCGYPYRALHYDVGPIKSFNMILPHHPDDLYRAQRAA